MLRDNSVRNNTRNEHASVRLPTIDVVHRSFGMLAPKKVFLLGTNTNRSKQIVRDFSTGEDR
jgi:hypothetical protein